MILETQHEEPAQRMKNILSKIVLCTGLPLFACVPVPHTQPDNVLIDMGQIETRTDGRCIARDTAPAVIETVTLQEIDQPELRGADGAITRPASFRTVTRQQIVRERADIRFETVCPQNYTVEFVSTLQRALKVRRFYNGDITGTLDRTTGTAVRNFQRDIGPDTALLSIAAARKLGIVALSKDALDTQ
jgi:hypothetical protein